MQPEKWKKTKKNTPHKRFNTRIYEKAFWNKWYLWSDSKGGIDLATATSTASGAAMEKLGHFQSLAWTLTVSLWEKKLSLKGG